MDGMQRTMNTGAFCASGYGNLMQALAMECAPRDNCPRPMDSRPAKPAQAQGSISEGEGTLVAQAKAGDVRAFEELVSRYERKIFRLAMNITQNKEDAEDVMQEAFLKAYSHLKDFQGDSRFYTWLVRITVNEGLMKLRKRRPGQVSIDEKIETEDDLIVRELEDWGPSPEQRYEQSEMQHILQSAIGEVDPAFGIVFALRDIEELSTEDTAEILGLSVPAVKSRLLRARLKLRQKLNRYFRKREEN